MKYIFLISIITYLIYFRKKLRKSMQMYQQEMYEFDKYLIFLKGRYKEYFLNYDLVFFLFLLFKYIEIKYAYLIFYIVYSVLLIIYVHKNKNKKDKKPLVLTARVKRMFFTMYALILIIILIIILRFNIEYYYVYTFILGLLLYLESLIPVIANIINKPIEKSVFLYYKNKCINKLKNMSNMEVIGITGSYGKTSSKNILNDILNSKYNAFPTPKNYNTPNGIMLSVNNYLDKFNDYFIVEMGAYKVGEIKELCDLVKPKYGILTKIGTAHLDTFLTVENIQKTKFELIENLKSDGIAILNKDDELQRNYKIKNKVKVLWIGIDNKDVDVYATNIKLTNKGTSFDCVFKDSKTKYKFETKLLGKANIYNILAGVLLGKVLGIGIQELIQSVKKIHPVEHRLELKNINGLNIIDDAYNSNPTGSKMALDVLSMMGNKRIIVTPGMIELGSSQYKLNKEFGMYMKGKVDEIILIGKKQTKPIFEGIKESKFNMKHVYVLDDISDAFPLIEKLKDKDTYVLLENDLPDLFKE